jgi:hypothetical protein
MAQHPRRAARTPVLGATPPPLRRCRYGPSKPLCTYSAGVTNWRIRRWLAWSAVSALGRGDRAPVLRLSVWCCCGGRVEVASWSMRMSEAGEVATTGGFRG